MPLGGGKKQNRQSRVRDGPRDEPGQFGGKRRVGGLAGNGISASRKPWARTPKGGLVRGSWPRGVQGSCKARLSIAQAPVVMAKKRGEGCRGGAWLAPFGQTAKTSLQQRPSRGVEHWKSQRMLNRIDTRQDRTVLYDNSPVQ